MSFVSIYSIKLISNNLLDNGYTQCSASFLSSKNNLLVLLSNQLIISVLSIHKVENGIITERLWQEQYNIVGTGIYTFTGITLDLAPGNYAYATNQTIIQGYRSINLENDNIFGLVPTLGATPYITGKSAGIVNLIPNPYPISQTDYFSSVPLVIFETELI